MEKWKKSRNFGKNLAEIWKFENIWKFVKNRNFEKKFGNLNLFLKSGNKLETWKTIVNLENIWKFGKTFENILF